MRHVQLPMLRNLRFGGLLALGGLGAGLWFSGLHAAEDHAGGVQVTIAGDGQVKVEGGDGNVQVVPAPGGGAQTAQAANGMAGGRVKRGGGAAVGGPVSPYGENNQGQTSATAVPGVLALIANTVDGWRTNPAEATRPEMLPPPAGYGPPIAMTELAEVDPKTTEAIQKVIADTEAKAAALVVQNAKHLDQLYRQRLTGARALLTPADQQLLDVLLEAWQGCDAAIAAVQETDPEKRPAALAEARDSFFRQFLAKADSAVAPRVVAAFANHRLGYVMPNELDRELCLYLGLGRLNWEELFGEAKPEAGATLRQLTADYWTVREAAHAAFRQALNELYQQQRDAVIAQFPDEKDRQAFAKPAAWLKANSARQTDLAAEVSGLSRHMLYDPKVDPAEQKKQWAEFNRQYREKANELQQLTHDYGEQWPEELRARIKDKQQRIWGQGAGGDRGVKPVNPQKQTPTEDEF